MKADVLILIETATDLFNDCCQQFEVSSEWKTAHPVSLFKNGDRKDLNRYRGSRVIMTFGRLFGEARHGKIQEDHGDQLDEGQSGFTTGRSCTDNLFILQQVYLYYWEKYSSLN